VPLLKTLDKIIYLPYETLFDKTNRIENTRYPCIPDGSLMGAGFEKDKVFNESGRLQWQ